MSTTTVPNAAPHVPGIPRAGTVEGLPAGRREGRGTLALSGSAGQDRSRPEPLDHEIDAKRQLPNEFRDRRDELGYGAWLDDAEQRAQGHAQSARSFWLSSSELFSLVDQPLMLPNPPPNTRPVGVVVLAERLLLPPWPDLRGGG